MENPQTVRQTKPPTFGERYEALRTAHEIGAKIDLTEVISLKEDLFYIYGARDMVSTPGNIDHINDDGIVEAMSYLDRLIETAVLS